MEKRVPYHNRYDSLLLEELRKLAAEKRVTVASLLDQAITLVLAKYKR